jgi:5-methylcytosine-specific restriction endonuclease McrA
VSFVAYRGDRMADMITCSRCGIVPRGHNCPYKTYKKKAYDTEADKFRKSKRWTNKSIEIRQRDRYLCRVCEANLYNTIQQFNFNDLDVHHIIPINEDYNKRLDNDNLITLCRYHHKMAEDGKIPREELYNIISE